MVPLTNPKLAQQLANRLKPYKEKLDRGERENMVRTALIAHTGFTLRRAGSGTYNVISADGHYVRVENYDFFTLEEVELALKRLGINPLKR
jgi:hypothetical protein